MPIRQTAAADLGPQRPWGHLHFYILRLFLDLGKVADNSRCVVKCQRVFPAFVAGILVRFSNQTAPCRPGVPGGHFPASVGRKFSQRDSEHIFRAFPSAVSCPADTPDRIFAVFAGKIRSVSPIQASPCCNPRRVNLIFPAGTSFEFGRMIVPGKFGSGKKRRKNWESHPGRVGFGSFNRFGSDPFTPVAGESGYWSAGPCRAGCLKIMKLPLACGSVPTTAG